MNTKLTLLLATMMVGASGAAFAQETATQSTTATTTIIRAISITPGTSLQFGRIVRPGTGDSVVTVSTAGARTVTSGTAALAGGTVTAAGYTVNGEGGQTFSLTTPASVTLTRVSGTETLSASLTSTASGTQSLSGALGAAGTFGFNIGGALTVSSTTVTGAYSGSYNVTVAYN